MESDLSLNADLEFNSNPKGIPTYEPQGFGSYTKRGFGLKEQIYGGI